MSAMLRRRGHGRGECEVRLTVDRGRGEAGSRKIQGALAGREQRPDTEARLRQQGQMAATATSARAAAAMARSKDGDGDSGRAGL
jgi:hypothetical protein